jgi:hypothetical protein
MQQKKPVDFEAIFRSEGLEQLPVGKCVAAGSKGEMMVCRTDENEWIAEGSDGVKFKGKIDRK